MPRKSGYDDVTKLKVLIKRPIFQAVAETQEYEGVYQQVNIPIKSMSVSEFRDMANSEKYAPPPHGSYDDLEKIYWDKMTTHHGIYGADITGSISDPDLKHWYIKKLDTILNYVEEDYKICIEGVNTAYLYFGMFKTSFAYHTEDMELYSINYLHFGQPKTWYSIPPSYGETFEELMKSIFPKTHKVCPAFLRHKMTIVNPEFLKRCGIPVDKVTQEAGQIMITFPNGYHSGFNHGFNCAESTNFATERWVEYGKHAKICYCCPDSVKISMDAFVERFQPDKFEAWKRGEDRTPHPETKKPLQRSQVSYKRASFQDRNPELDSQNLLDNPTISSEIKQELSGSFLVSADDEIANMQRENYDYCQAFMDGDSDEEFKPKLKKKSKRDIEQDDDWFETKGHEFISEDGKTVRRTSGRKRKPTSKVKALIESDDSLDDVVGSSESDEQQPPPKARKSTPAKPAVKKTTKKVDKKTNSDSDAIIETYETEDKRVTVVTAKPTGLPPSPVKTDTPKPAAPPKSSDGGFASAFAAFIQNSQKDQSDMDPKHELKETAKKATNKPGPKPRTPATPGQAQKPRGRPAKKMEPSPSLQQQQEQWTEEIIKQSSVLSNSNAANVLVDNDRVKTERIPHAITYPPVQNTTSNQYQGKTITMVLPANTRITKIS